MYEKVIMKPILKITRTTRKVVEVGGVGKRKD
jgi:hypothetical protein